MWYTSLIKRLNVLLLKSLAKGGGLGQPPWESGGPPKDTQSSQFIKKHGAFDATKCTLNSWYHYFAQSLFIELTGHTCYWSISESYQWPVWLNSLKEYRRLDQNTGRAQRSHSTDNNIVKSTALHLRIRIHRQWGKISNTHFQKSVYKFLKIGVRVMLVL